VYGDYGKPDPLAPVVRAVEHGEVDAAVVWGPIAGWYGRSLHVAKLPYPFSIAAGVRKKDRALRDELQAALDRRQDDIRAVLARFGVPEAP
jgi:mxaJ protein